MFVVFFESCGCFIFFLGKDCVDLVIVIYFLDRYVVKDIFVQVFLWFLVGKMGIVYLGNFCRVLICIEESNILIFYYYNFQMIYFLSLRISDYLRWVEGNVLEGFQFNLLVFRNYDLFSKILNFVFIFISFLFGLKFYLIFFILKFV